MGHPSPIRCFPIYAVSPSSQRLESAYPYGNKPGGSITDGGGYIIQGSGFGLNSNTSQMWLGGVNGAVESIPADTNCDGYLGSGWTYPGDSKTVARTVRSYNGTKSLANDNVTSTHFQFGIVFDTGARYFSHYIQYNMYLYNPDLVNPMQLKLTRRSGTIANASGLGDADHPDCYMTRFVGGINSGFVNNGGSSGTIGPSQGGGVVGGWFLDNLWCRVEETFYPGTVGNSDGVWTWCCRRLDTGAIISSGTVSGQNFWDNAYAANPYRYEAFQGYFGNWNGTTLNAALYWDRDIYSAWNYASATHPKFVLMGDASTYSTCNAQNFTLQPLDPGTGPWTDTQIPIKVNKGVNANLVGKYLYPMSGINTPIQSAGIPLI